MWDPDVYSHVRKVQQMGPPQSQINPIHVSAALIRLQATWAVVMKQAGKRGKTAHDPWTLSVSNPSAVTEAMDIEASLNVMAHAQKPDFVFRRNGRVHLNSRGR